MMDFSPRDQLGWSSIIIVRHVLTDMQSNIHTHTHIHTTHSQRERESERESERERKKEKKRESHLAISKPEHKEKPKHRPPTARFNGF